MVATIKLQSVLGTSLSALVAGFVLTKQTEDKSPRTVEYYRENLRRFMWYAKTQGWCDDVRELTEWHIRDFLGYVATQKFRWGILDDGAKTTQKGVSHTTIHHYFVVLSCFCNWLVQERFLAESPAAKIRMRKPKPRLIAPYSAEEIKRILRICDYDYEHNSRFLASRNRAIILVLLDTGVRLLELVSIKLNDIDTGSGNPLFEQDDTYIFEFFQEGNSTRTTTEKMPRII